MLYRKFVRTNESGVATLKSVADIPLLHKDLIAQGWSPLGWDYVEPAVDVVDAATESLDVPEPIAEDAVEPAVEEVAPAKKTTSKAK